MAKPPPLDLIDDRSADERLREELYVLLGPAEEARIDRIVEAIEALIVAVTVQMIRHG